MAKPLRQIIQSATYARALPVISTMSIKQYEYRHPGVSDALIDLGRLNPELATWMRLEASRQYPDDLPAREKTVELALAVLTMVRTEQTKADLQEAAASCPRQL